ncbi:MAG: metalloregulator ArsR/SmtB family transcription factor [Corynebacterium sp.]|nr:metalloregulator ArsR/SmtB family transcription factor [Corynebacterium sp.]MDO4610321.1 metalloregulator ArsR/SmtB family transcription factor [Corynebacterium sp.]
MTFGPETTTNLCRSGVHEEHQRTDIGEASPYIDAAVEVFSMLADPTRVRIVLILREGELPVGELAKRVGKTPTSVSQHLAKLRMARMVAARQEGTRVFYRLLDAHASELVVQALYQAEHTVDESFPPHAR